MLVQIYRPETATVPSHIFLRRSILAGLWSTFFIGATTMITVYFLPIWFQAIKGASAVDSGIHLLPMLLPMIFASIFTGVLVSKIGYYTPFMICGVCILCVGAGLLTTLQVDSSSAKWIGYQVVFGFGLGLTFQAPNLAAQTVLPQKDVSVGTSLMFFGQLLGGSVFISVGQNVLNTELIKRLSPLPGFDPALLSDEGATTLIQKLPEAIRPAVLIGYNDSLRRVFQVGLIMTCLVVLGAISMEWRSVKQNAPKKATSVEDGRKEGKEMDGGASEAAKDEAKA